MENSAKSNIIKIMIVILIIALALLGYLYYRLNDTAKKASQTETEEIAVDEAYFSTATDTPPLVYEIDPLSIDNCDHIDDDEEKQLCLDKYLYNRYVLDQDLKGCTKIHDLAIRDDCIFEIAKQQTNELGSEKNCERIVGLQRRWDCYSVTAIYRPYSMENDVCEKVYAGRPFIIKECQDRSLAMQVHKMITDEDDMDRKLEIIDLCSNDLALEYGSLCIANALRAIDNDCSLIKNELIKGYCETYLIDEKEIRTVSDCNAMPLDNYRKVCLAEIDSQKSRYELDSDNDGKSDGGELFYNIDPFNPDTDGDGLLDGNEILVYSTNPASADSDYDGLNDYDEIENGTDPQNPDTDGDGLKDGDDSDPKDAANDTDGDKLSDEIERKYGTDINSKDTDGDGVGDAAEIMYYGTNPLGEGWEHDTDGDGLKDIDEIFYFTDIFKADTDGDGINDAAEVEGLSDPLGPGDMDFDGDGYSDRLEVERGSNPSLDERKSSITAPSTSNNAGIEQVTPAKALTIEDVIEQESASPKDKDNDGIHDDLETSYGTDMNKADTDDDGLDDLEELQVYQTDPVNPDTDGDGYSDGEEVKNGFDPLGA